MVQEGLPLPLPHPGVPGLHLRRLCAADAALFHAAVTTPAVGRMLFRFPADWPLAEARALVADHATRAALPMRLAIADGDGGFLGSIGLVGRAGDELAYFIAPGAAGRGIMRAALGGFIGWAFAQGDLPALRASVYHDNPASLRLLRAAGFVETGRDIAGCSAQRDTPEMLHYLALPRAAWTG